MASHSHSARMAFAGGAVALCTAVGREVLHRDGRPVWCISGPATSHFLVLGHASSMHEGEMLWQGLRCERRSVWCILSRARKLCSDLFGTRPSLVTWNPTAILLRGCHCDLHAALLIFWDQVKEPTIYSGYRHPGCQFSNHRPRPAWLLCCSAGRQPGLGTSPPPGQDWSSLLGLCHP